MRVLIVEDSRAMRAIIERMFSLLGLETTQASDGAEALQTLQSDANYDLALVDWNMPKLNGLELVKAIRADDTFKNIKLMMATTETEIERVVLALNEGADEYVMKPFTKDVLKDKLKILGLLND